MREEDPFSRDETSHWADTSMSSQVPCDISHIDRALGTGMGLCWAQLNVAYGYLGLLILSHHVSRCAAVSAVLSAFVWQVHSDAGELRNPVRAVALAIFSSCRLSPISCSTPPKALTTGEETSLKYKM